MIMKIFFLCICFISITCISFSQTNYVDVVKKDLKKKWTLKKGVGKITELKKDLYVSSKNGNYNLIVYRFSVVIKLVGDLDNDGKNEHLIIVPEEGGGEGGNVGSNLAYVVYDKPAGVFIVKEIGGIVNPPKNEDGCYFDIEEIRDGFLYGTLNVCTKRGESKYDEIWENVKAKCKIVNNKLQLMD
jgi:hypothetical protein